MTSTASKPSRPSLSAWRSPAAWAWMLLACILSTGIDLLSKQLAFDHVAPSPVIVDAARVIDVKERIDPRAITQEIVPDHPPMVVIPQLLQFQLVLNPGAVFGIGPGKRLFFISFTVLALGFSLLMFARWTTSRDHFAHAAIGMLLGGGLGNLYDRLVHACVRDFIHPFPGWNWPFGWTFRGGHEIWPYVSNLADLFLLVGIFMLLVHLYRRDRAVERAVALAKEQAANRATQSPSTRNA